MNKFVSCETELNEYNGNCYIDITVELDKYLEEYYNLKWLISDSQFYPEKLFDRLDKVEFVIYTLMDFDNDNVEVVTLRLFNDKLK